MSLLKNYSAAIILLLLCACEPEDATVFTPKELHIELRLRGNFELVKQGYNGDDRFLSYKSSTDFLNVKTFVHLNHAAAFKRAEDELTLIRSLYTRQYVPYPDKITYRKGCLDEFQPIELPHQKSPSIFSATVLKANNRFSYGGCTGDSNHYLSALIFCYSEKDSCLMRINYFTPLDAPANDPLVVINSLKCF
jgi:hypothetical protein